MNPASRAPHYVGRASQLHFDVPNGVCFGRFHSFCPSFPPLIVLPLCARSNFAHPTGLKQ
jgi:hypothetical protein